MTTISQADPTAEAVKNMFSPDQSGISYIMKRYIVEDLASGNANAFAFAVQNPEGVDCLVTNVIVDITTAGGTASSVLDVDVDVDVDDGATDTGDDIIDGPGPERHQYCRPAQKTLAPTVGRRSSGTRTAGPTTTLPARSWPKMPPAWLAR